nr:hypothetical protein [Brevundimonas sp.]
MKPELEIVGRGVRQEAGCVEHWPKFRRRTFQDQGLADRPGLAPRRLDQLQSAKIDGLFIGKVETDGVVFLEGVENRLAKDDDVLHYESSVDQHTFRHTPSPRRMTQSHATDPMVDDVR